MDLPAALASSYRAFMDGQELTGAFLDGVERVWGPPVEVARNLFTNPNLVGDGTWAEVRRNLESDPSFEGSRAWTQQSVSATRSTEWASTGEKSMRLEGAGEAHSATIYRPLSNWGLEEGKTYTALVKVHLPSPLTGPLNQSALSLSVNTVVGAGAYAPNEAGTHELRYTFTVGESAITTSTLLRLYHGATADNGVSYWDDLLIVEGDYSGGFFDGSTTPATAQGVDHPEDFRWRWLGAENASESVMEIEQVAGLAGISAIAGVSTWEGKPAARVISTTTSGTTSRVQLNIPTEARGGGTMLGTVNLKAPLEGVLEGRSRRIVVVNPIYTGESVPNEQGSYPRRVAYGALTANYVAQLWHGGALGSGDVWWTDLGLFAGDYPGGVFSGDTPDTDRDSYTWAGERNNSPSIHRRYE